MREIDQALFDAISKDRPERIGPLIARGANTDAYHEQSVLRGPPIHLAAWRGRMACLRELFNVGVSPNSLGPDIRSPLHIAASADHRMTVTLLLEVGADVNLEDRRGRTPLHSAATGGHVECINLLLAAGADINKFANTYGTPLCQAAAHGHIHCVRTLLTNGAKSTLNMRPHPLTAFVEGCDHTLMSASDALHMLNMLLDAGADPSGIHEGLCNLYSRDSKTVIDVMHVALRRELLEYLVTLGLVNRYNDEGYTLLQIMCLYGMDETASDLALALKAGADPDAITILGKTPLQLLKDRKFPPQTLVDLLLARVADNGKA